MKRFLKAIALMAAFMVISAPAWSLHYNDHVSISGSGQGDVLIYPVYVGSDGGNQTKIQVINTSMNLSAVVKVVVRSAKYSQECRDFFLFLSPTDMWEGTLMWKNGETVLWTDDDSFLRSSAPAFASKAVPFELNMVDPGCDDFCNLGYVEAILSWVFPRFPIGVDKEDIYDEYVGTGSLGAPQPLTGYAPGDRGGFNTNILAGNLEVQSTLVDWNAALNAVALKDYGNTVPLNPAIETIFGEDSRNSMDEVEAALNIDNVAMPYYSRAGIEHTHHIFTFPTKLSILDGCNVVDTEGNYTGFCIGANCAFDDEVQYSVRAMDMKENVIAPGEDVFSPQRPDATFTFPYELNAVFPSPRDFTEGWFRYRFTEGETAGWTRGTLGNHAGGRDPIRYTGAPAIPVVMNWGVDGLSLKYGSSEDGFFIDQFGDWKTSGGGKVYGTLDGTPGGVRTGLPGYQYSRMTPNTL